MPRFYCPTPLHTGLALSLPPGAARHVQVLRLQPGDPITLFNGQGGEYTASVTRMGRSDVDVAVLAHHAVERQAPRAVHLAVGMPANERMDWLVEKAAELGAASIAPLQTSRTVLKLSGERAVKKQQHWQSVATAACEQCGGNAVPQVAAISEFGRWLQALPAPQPSELRCLLSLSEGSVSLAQALAARPSNAAVLFVSGPEGGLTPQEETLARTSGFVPITLGPRVLRAETAALAALVSATQLSAAPQAA